MPRAIWLPKPLGSTLQGRDRLLGEIPNPDAIERGADKQARLIRRQDAVDGGLDRLTLMRNHSRATPG
jgi:hypothetical protein